MIATMVMIMVVAMVMAMAIVIASMVMAMAMVTIFLEKVLNTVVEPGKEREKKMVIAIDMETVAVQ
jgi:hypothetical protein